MKKLILFAIILMMGSSLIAQQGPRAQRQGPDGDKNRVERMDEFLDLTDTQKSKIEDLRIAHLREIAPLTNELDIKNAQLKAAVESDQKIDPIINEINSLKGQLFTLQVHHQVAVRNTLNDDQKLKFDQMKKRKSGLAGNKRKR